MNDPDQVYEQWADKQRAMGHPIPVTTAPHYAKPPKRTPKRGTGKTVMSDQPGEFMGQPIQNLLGK